ncbi:N-acetylmuramoyl-L-alanine amidase [Rhodoblastus acidophilus]|uniref:N-acetylmuramoyl-L-alanine amidase n=1 Tax=Candidatus Rhodoblastus alkanivorans TaxID=2954117 RepID=A0ABS9Z8M9_9HYPH|nr:N-acetylmuramoyl-L-alanine amidase [Candidatus Rhodoblastus alkanivorans]MCI4680564.1 N-acetylmuramoyl-L-alanine amidase [Candidatus Rhodoblastus alkanivorans]MCI4683973.1 N-acetylmuramoyl-L-alanine amidase [Candidatus Rhodoblastus alkanivorans]MDI4641292.1 N-acetylmuramoyl-L-alanine amidase [Rhodoblastus acidophilus]
MSPDSPLAGKFHPSPNHGARLGSPTDIIVLHYTGMPTGEAALELLCAPDSQVSCHYVIWEDGRIWQLVPESRRAWHAGKSFWAGEKDLNSRSIGIELVHPGHRGGSPPYAQAQIAATIALVRDISDRLKIRPERILAHSDIAPARKRDPGEFFPWDRLNAAGLGHWAAAAPIRPGPAYEQGAMGPPVAALQSLLAAYGYEVAPSGAYDEATRDAIAAFQRHFRPEKVDGIADLSTVETLRNLLQSLPGAAA